MIRIGIVGLGGIGTVHYRNYQYIDQCKVVAAVCHSEESKLKARRLNLIPYDDLEAMITSEDLDVIDICTPTYLHKAHVLEALNFSKHVIVEKPIALSTQDAQEMFDLAAEMGLFLFVGHVVQFAKETEILRDALRTQKYGRPLDAYFQRLAGRPQWSKSGWLLDKEKSGVIPFDLHVHDLDLIISLFGKPKSFTYVSSGRAEVDYQETYRINYAFADLNITAEAAWFNANYPFTATWRVYFERGLLEYNGKNVVLYQIGQDPTFFDLREEVVVAPGINLPPTGMFYNELSHFVDCLVRGKSSERVRPEQILAGVEIMEEILNGE